MNSKHIWNQPTFRYDELVEGNKERTRLNVSLWANINRF